MTAVDTNVIVRLLVEDDARQAAAARAVFGGGPELYSGRTRGLSRDYPDLAAAPNDMFFKRADSRPHVGALCPKPQRIRSRV